MIQFSSVRLAGSHIGLELVLYCPKHPVYRTKCRAATSPVSYTHLGVKLIHKGTPATRLDEDMVDIPDLAQTFVVTCCLMDIPFRFTDVYKRQV